MRCQEIRKAFEAGEVSGAEVKGHLKECPACRAVAGDWNLLRAGFMGLRTEEPPEPSWGFLERLQRRLGTAVQDAGADWMDVAGRRIVYVTLLITVFVLLGLVVPSSSPLRAGGSAEVLGARPVMAQINQAAPIGLSAIESASSLRTRATTAGGQPQP
jgi:hypothetical protein